MASVNKESFHKFPLEIMAKAFEQVGYNVALKEDSFIIKQDLCNWMKIRYIPERGGCLIKIFSTWKGIEFSSRKVDEAVEIAKKLYKGNPTEKSVEKPVKETTKEPVEKQTETVKSHFCTECGTKLPLDAKFCPNCGQKIE